MTVSGPLPLSPHAQGGTGSRSSERWYRMMSAAVATGVAVFCVAFAALGEHRRGDATFYFIEREDIGHPAIVSALTATGFLATALVAGVVVLASDARGRLRRTWSLVGLLFVAIWADALVRLHPRVPLGPLAFRLVYLMALVVIAVWMRGLVGGRRGLGVLLCGFVLLAVSESIDIITGGDEVARSHRVAKVLAEESARCLGAWCCALGTAGIASLMLAARVRDQT